MKLTDKKIQNNVGDDEIKRAEINNCSHIITTISLPITESWMPITKWWSSHTIMHYIIPIFSSY